ncbi:MAG: hypothetical protein ACRCUY_04335 [Thermoguttaceae bacterium]
MKHIIVSFLLIWFSWMLLDNAAAQTEVVRTNNFIIQVELSQDHPRPTPKEIGILVERLCAQLDKIFSKYAPVRVAKEYEDSKQAEAEGKKKPASKPTSKQDVNQDIPDTKRIIPTCHLFLFNSRSELTAKCSEDGIEPLDSAYAGFYTSKNDSIYMVRGWNLQSDRETILHETTHYYTYNFLPGGHGCYPSWFHEALAQTYAKHTWNGDLLQIAIQPRIQPFDEPAVALEQLKRFRRFVQSDSPIDSKTAPNQNSAKGKKNQKTPFDPGMIGDFLDTQFTPEAFQADKIPLKNSNEAISHKYAMYTAFGRFLLFARPDHIAAILRQIALWDHANDKTFPRSRWFDEAWKIVAADKPITVEDIGMWIQKDQLPFQWTFGEWQDLGNAIAGRAEKGRISILALKIPAVMPKYTAFPKNFTDFKVGMVFNFVNRENFATVYVDERGKVILAHMQNGIWTTGKLIGSIEAASVKTAPYPGGPAFHFAALQNGSEIVISINQVPAGPFPKIPGSTCGIYLGETDAIFSY